MSCRKTPLRSARSQLRSVSCKAAANVVVFTKSEDHETSTPTGKPSIDPADQNPESAGGDSTTSTKKTMPSRDQISPPCGPHPQASGCFPTLETLTLSLDIKSLRPLGADPPLPSDGRRPPGPRWGTRRCSPAGACRSGRGRRFRSGLRGAEVMGPPVRS